MAPDATSGRNSRRCRASRTSVGSHAAPRLYVCEADAGRRCQAASVARSSTAADVDANQIGEDGTPANNPMQAPQDRVDTPIGRARVEFNEKPTFLKPARS